MLMKGGQIAVLVMAFLHCWYQWIVAPTHPMAQSGDGHRPPQHILKQGLGILAFVDDPVCGCHADAVAIADQPRVALPQRAVQGDFVALVRLTPIESRSESRASIADGDLAANAEVRRGQVRLRHCRATEEQQRQAKTQARQAR